MDTLPHGTRLRLDQGRLVGGEDREGHEAFTLRWDGPRLSEATLWLPDRRTVRIRADATTHPLFGRSDEVWFDDEAVTVFQAVDWTAPQTIPPLDRPTALPPGAGAAILNLLALQAHRAGRPTLRYQGPYATGALFDALHASFAPVGPTAEAFRRFVDEVERTSLTGEMRTAPVDWVPAPHEWVWPAERICAQLRDGPERVFLDGLPYDRVATGSRRLDHLGEHWHARVYIAGQVWADIAVFEEGGRLVQGPRPLPSLPPGLVGAPVPTALRRALLTGLPPRAPALLREAVVEVLYKVPLRWGDAATEEATVRDGEIVLHAVLAQRLQGSDPRRALDAVARALEPVLHQLAQERMGG